MTKVIDSPVDDPDALFRFDVQLESNENHTLVGYNQGPYYIVKTNEEGTDQYYKYENGQLIPSPNNEPVAYTRGINGAIDNIQEGYTILIKGLLAGTDFRVVENLSEREMPEGYMYVSTVVEHAGEPDINESQGTIQVYTVSQGEQEVKKDALVTITNRPTGKLIVEKRWESGNFVTTHGDVYVAVYHKTTDSGGEDSLELLEDTVRKLVYDTKTGKYRTEYYLPDANFSSYVVREVKVTFGNDGKITSVEPLSENAKITVSGEITSDSASAADTKDNSYVVSYEEGEEGTYNLPDDQVGGTGKQGHTRTDTVVNTLPKVSLYKTNEATQTGKKYLKDAVFALEHEDGTPYKDSSNNPITFTSDDNGKLFADRYFSNGTYYLRETSAPPGYQPLSWRIVLTVLENTITAAAESPGTVVYENLAGSSGNQSGSGDDQTGSDDNQNGTGDGQPGGSSQSDGNANDQDDEESENTAATAAVFRFEIMNNPGVSLPSTGGPGTGLITLTGTLLALLAVVGLLLKRQQRGQPQE